MKKVLNKQSGTGNAYKMGNADIGVKTGTAQIANPKGGGYLKGDSNYIFSVVEALSFLDIEMILLIIGLKIEAKIFSAVAPPPKCGCLSVK